MNRAAPQVQAFRTVVGAVIGVLACAIAPAAAQRTSIWLDANGSHSRPPSGASIGPASYGLFGARLRVDNRRSAFELGADAGRGVNEANGAWLSGRAAFDVSRARGHFDYGVHATAGGLTYLAPLQIGASTEYEQSLLTGTIRPQAGVSIGGTRIGLEASLTGGRWMSETASLLSSGPGLPLPGRDRLEWQRVEQQGDVTAVGGAASLLRIVGPATVELRAGSVHARNQVENGRYAGIDGTVALSLGILDLTTGARYWRVPGDDAELGGHIGLGYSIGDRTYVQAIASRSISDPIYGSEGGLGLNIGISMRIGGAAKAASNVASVGAASGRGRIVRFTFESGKATSVAVAGDFTNWKPRAMGRGAGNTWILETVIEPGVHHFSFIVDGTRWMVPDDAPGLVDDGWGRRNATVIVPTTERQATQ